MFNERTHPLLQPFQTNSNRKEKRSTQSSKVRTSKLSLSHLFLPIFSSHLYLLFQLVMTQIIIVPFYLITKHHLHTHQIKSRFDNNMSVFPSNNIITFSFASYQDYPLFDVICPLLVIQLTSKNVNITAPVCCSLMIYFII